MSAEPCDLQCQKCSAVYGWRGTKVRTETAARFMEWRVFEGTSMTGAEIKVVLCPKDSGVEKKGRHRKHEPLDDQEPLDFEVD